VGRITASLTFSPRKVSVAARCHPAPAQPESRTSMSSATCPTASPAILEKIVAANILLISTPTWVGHMSSIAPRVLERLDAELSATDDQGCPRQVGKVALAAVVGNEDGAHKVVADLFQALNDIGFTIPAQGCTYWNDEAMGSRDFNDLDESPKRSRASLRRRRATQSISRNCCNDSPIRCTPDRDRIVRRRRGGSLTASLR
jgi:NAD(P)H-dependent FMN reductase